MNNLFKINVLSFCFAFFFNTAVSQNNESDSIASQAYKKKYLNYLLVADDNVKAPLVFVNYQYLCIPKTKTFRSGGAYANFGLNLARFFTKKIMFGVSFDVKAINGVLKQHLPSQFVTDFNSNSINLYNSEKDSLLSYTLKKVVNGEGEFGISGNNISGYGVCFSPFPDKYGGFLFQFKKNTFSFPLYGTVIDKIHKNDEGNYIMLDFERAYSIEITCNPYKFSQHKRIKVRELKTNPYKFLTISFYYQHFSFTNTKLDYTPLSTFVNQKFIMKYNNVNNYGFKIGVSIY